MPAVAVRSLMISLLFSFALNAALAAAPWTLSETHSFSNELLRETDPAKLVALLQRVAAEPSSPADPRAARLFTQAISEALKRLTTEALKKNLPDHVDTMIRVGIQEATVQLTRFSQERQFALAETTLNSLLESMKAFAGRRQHEKTYRDQSTLTDLRKGLSGANWASPPTRNQIEEIRALLAATKKEGQVDLFLSMARYPDGQSMLIDYLQNLQTTRSDFDPNLRDTGQRVTAHQNDLERTWAALSKQKLDSAQRARLVHILESDSSRAKVLTALTSAPELLETLSPRLDIGLRYDLPLEVLINERARLTESQKSFFARATDATEFKEPRDAARQEITNALRKTMRESVLESLRDRDFMLEITGRPQILLSKDPRLERLKDSLRHATEIAGTDRDLAMAATEWKTLGYTFTDKNKDAVQLAEEIRKKVFEILAKQSPRSFEVEMQMVRLAVSDPSVQLRHEFLSTLSEFGRLDPRASDWLRQHLNQKDPALNLKGKDIRASVTRLATRQVSSGPGTSGPECIGRFAVIPER